MRGSIAHTSMDNKAFAYLIRLLQSAIASRDSFPQDEFMPLAPDEWREVYRLAAKHAVIAVAWSGVENLQSSALDAIKTLPADLMGKWFADVQAIHAANIRMAKQSAQLQARLKNSGFCSQILKGASLAAYYPEPVRRQSADIDLWVTQPNNTQTSLRALRQTLLAYLRQQPDIAIGEIVYHHIETEINGTEVEFHVTPTWLCNPVHNRRLQQSFARSGQLTPELQELYTLLHAFRHIYHDGIALRHLLDYHLVCRHNRNIGVQAPQTLYSRLGLLTFARALDDLTEHYFGNQPSPASLNPCARHILQALPERQVSRTIRHDYLSESLFNLPWRTVHYLWRKTNHYV